MVDQAVDAGLGTNTGGVSSKSDAEDANCQKDTSGQQKEDEDDDLDEEDEHPDDDNEEELDMQMEDEYENDDDYEYYDDDDEDGLEGQEGGANVHVGKFLLYGETLNAQF